MIRKRVPELSQEVVDVPVEQHVEQVVHVPVVLRLVFQFPTCAFGLGQRALVPACHAMEHRGSGSMCFFSPFFLR